MRATQLLTLLALAAGCPRGGEPPHRVDGAATRGDTPPPGGREPPPGGDVSAPTASADATMVEGTYFVLPGAPAPLDCTADADCVGETVVASDGCCVASPTPRPQTWAYKRWVGARRMSAACRLDDCPPSPEPSRPDDCYFRVRCDAGRCRNACPS